ncbi:hypothetical protein [Streptomyces sp. NPDC090131]|uniref:hypothetical protein n=1 Tax=Streptomyces sp. NPDC090131 TaxID=3365954 RepID=UPI003815B8A1
MADTNGLSRREAAARRARWAAEKERLRRLGRLCDSRRALVTGGLAKVIADREWDRNVPPALPGQARGRWVGSPQGSWPEKLTVELPADLVTTTQAGCWHASREATDALHKWHEHNPGARPNRPEHPRCGLMELDHYQRLAAEILTPGHIWREAVLSGIAAASLIWSGA